MNSIDPNNEVLANSSEQADAIKREDAALRNKSKGHNIKTYIIIAIAAVLSIAIVFGSIAIIKTIKKSSLYDSAIVAMADKDYKSAVSSFVELGDYKDSNRNIHDIMSEIISGLQTKITSALEARTAYIQDESSSLISQALYIKKVGGTHTISLDDNNYNLKNMCYYADEIKEKVGEMKEAFDKETLKSCDESIKEAYKAVIAIENKSNGFFSKSEVQSYLYSAISGTVSNDSSDELLDLAEKLVQAKKGLNKNKD